MISSVYTNKHGAEKQVFTIAKTAILEKKSRKRWRLGYYADVEQIRVLEDGKIDIVMYDYTNKQLYKLIRVPEKNYCVARFVVSNQKWWKEGS